MTFITPDQRTEEPIFVPLDFDWQATRRENIRRAKLKRYQLIWEEVQNRHPKRPKLGHVDLLVDSVCAIAEITRDQIFSKNRIRRIAWTRQAIFVVIRNKWPEYSSLEIARKFNMDHSTIVFAWRKYVDMDCADVRRIPKDHRIQFRDYVDGIKAQLKGQQP